MDHWTYREETLPEDPTDRHAILENLGAFGWELASVDRGIAYLKRQAPKSDSDKLHDYKMRLQTEAECYVSLMNGERGRQKGKGND